MTPSSYEDQDAAPDSDLPATDARDDFAADPAEAVTSRPIFEPVFLDRQKAPEAANAAPSAPPPAQDGPEAPEPATAAPAAPTAPKDAPVTAYPELHSEHPARLPPAARPIRQG